jgi:hypothetical protein
LVVAGEAVGFSMADGFAVTQQRNTAAGSGVRALIRCDLCHQAAELYVLVIEPVLALQVTESEVSYEPAYGHCHE